MDKQTFHLFSGGLSGADLRDVDMSSLSQETFKRLTFDSETEFPKDQETHAKQLIEQGKFSNTLEGLHKERINGEGTTIVLIDSLSNSQTSEFEGRDVENIVFKENDDGTISYEKYEKEYGDNHHGKTTASLATGNKCGVAPKAKVYLFGTAEGTDWTKAQETILKYIEENMIEKNKIPDIISMSADMKISVEDQKIIDRLKEQECAFLNSKEFWKDFLWGRVSYDGKEVLLDELIKEVVDKGEDKKYDENSTPGKSLTKARDNVLRKEHDMAVLPCTGVTCLKDGKEGVYKYIGSFCGASFAIPQVAGLFLLARQIDPEIKYKDFINIVKNPERMNSDGMMYVDFKETIKEIQERKQQKETPFISNESTKKIANSEDVAMHKQNAKSDVNTLENEQKIDKDNVQAIN